MENEIEKSDPATLMQGVKDRIKATFVSLIPEAQWEQMVKTEVDFFFKERELGWNKDRKYASDFQILVKEMIDSECKKRLAEYLSSPEFLDTWNNNGIPTASTQVKKILVDNSGEIFANMMGGVFQNMLAGFRNQLQNRQY